MNEATIAKYMTATPHSIGQQQSLAKAAEVMRKHQVRHLPVLNGGELVGVVSERDIAVVSSLSEIDPNKLSVEEAMNQDPYFVGPDADLKEVAQTMAEHKYGCAVVMNGRQVVGIFTAIDAMEVLASLL